MTESFHIDVSLDEASGIFRVVATGPMDSDRFVDSQLEFFASVEKPWAYNRLVDLRDCAGTCAYESLSRFADYWISRRSRIDHVIRAAIVTRSGLTVARLPTIELMFPKHEMHAFSGLDQAEAWLAQGMTPTA